MEQIATSCFSFDSNILKEISGTNTIITPCAGEYKRIFAEENLGISKKEQISDIQRLAKQYGITIILKGWLILFLIVTMNKLL
jgi:NAD(P)H-hydrate repair Nnr-like enzyme with NAD(P)H-hydrate dehydratase domain